MKALLVVAITWCIAAGLGRSAIALLFGQRRDAVPILRPLEAFTIASALGLGIVAYGVAALGLIGLLTRAWLAVWLAAAGLAGLPGMLSLIVEARAALNSRIADAPAAGARFDRAIAVASCYVLILLAAVAIVACFQPPEAHAWDALAYHLADPKLYLQAHRMAPLPTEHHSNFPFTMEMLFTIGLAFQGFAAANLFHLVTGVLICLALVAFGDRFLSRTAGLLSAVLFASTPLVMWEATVAYIDLGLALYVFLAAHLVMLVSRAPLRVREGASVPVARLLVLTGAVMGFALGIKYLALVPLVILIVLALARRIPVRQVACFAMVACAVGSPWYIKNTIWMRNPVYPFAYSIFPSSRYWSADRAAPYSAEQDSFGTEHSLRRPVESIRNLATTPWMLITDPQLFTNRADFTFTSLIGGLYVGFIFSLTFVRGKPREIVELVATTAALFVAWFFVAQHIRYLVLALPFGALLSGYAASYWLGVPRRSEPVDVGPAGSPAALRPMARLVVAGAVVGQVAVLGWGICALPVGGREAVQAVQAGLEPTALSLPEALDDLVHPDQRDRHLRRLNTYGADEWINRNVPSGQGVVLYEDVHGYYLDRPYLWGNGEHSSYIPYVTFRTGADLTRWLRAHDIRYALFNLNNGPQAAASQMLIPDDPSIVDAILRQWYPSTGSGWRQVVGDAIQSGAWVVCYAHHGVVVLDIGAVPR